MRIFEKLGVLVLAAAALAAQSGKYTLIGWNDLGMHCMDGDYTVYAILPPYNTIHAQLIDSSGKLVKNPAGITVTYAPKADASGSINTVSGWKTNFWRFAQALFGVALPSETGLAGYAMPGLSNSVAMKFDSAYNWFSAEGIPVTPYDDAGNRNYYPMMRLTASDTTGRILATTDIVLAVSDEMSCKACHASNARRETRPSGGWANDPFSERDYKKNILALHDDRQSADPVFASALAGAGYSPSGLAATAAGGKPVLCATCHPSNALGTAGQPGVAQLTTAIHGHHAGITDPETGTTLDSSDNRSACYRCHPGASTRCLRGTMGNSVAADGAMAIQCQDCHGSMSAVASARQGWLEEPNCQSCHTGTATSNSGLLRYTSVFENGQPRKPADTRFATTPNQPAAGLSLYRFSAGHGGLACEACHGSTHAEFPSLQANDNAQSVALQGYAGALAECGVCHTSISNPTGGPHGLHVVGQAWVSAHPRYAGSSCRECHGTDYRGTVLSRAAATRTLNAFGGRQVFRGAYVGCYLCHSGPTDDRTNNSIAPVASAASASTTTGTPVRIALAATSGTVRIVSQPLNGTVALQGSAATYLPFPGTEGSDSFTFAAYDGMKNSNAAKVTVNVTAPARPVFAAASVGNAASYASGPIAPGEMITLFGTGLGPELLAGLDINSAGLVSRDLAGTRVLFDGNPAPLVYTSSAQLSAIVPFSLAGKTSTSAQVEYQGIRSQPVQLALAPTVPGLFSANARGSGQAAVLNQDGVTSNSPSAPAAKGSIVTLFATGAGTNDNPVIDGALTGDPVPRPLAPIAVQMGGVDADVVWYGSAPGLVAGIVQVNVRIPASAPSGPAVPLVLKAGNAASQAGTTIAIQ